MTTGIQADNLHTFPWSRSQHQGQRPRILKDTTLHNDVVMTYSIHFQRAGFNKSWESTSHLYSFALVFREPIPSPSFCLFDIIHLAIFTFNMVKHIAYVCLKYHLCLIMFLKHPSYPYLAVHPPQEYDAFGLLSIGRSCWEVDSCHLLSYTYIVCNSMSASCQTLTNSPLHELNASNSHDVGLQHLGP